MPMDLSILFNFWNSFQIGWGMAIGFTAAALQVDL